MTRFCKIRAAALAVAMLLSVFAALAETATAYDMSAPENLQADQLFAESALLIDEDTGEVLFSRNVRVRMYPASCTKIMTLLLGLESGIALDSDVTIPAEAADIPDGSSVIPVKPGDVTSFEDLLAGFMLSSGNDGANAIAVLVSGGIEPFVARMNARAEEMGCEGTHFVNAHGYHDSGHFTTARDLAVMAREAMKNPEFRRIVAAPRWTMRIRRGDKEADVEIVSRNSLLQSDLKYYYPDCTGIKTGHHSKAGWCFVGSAERNGMRLICVVLNCAQENDKWYDAARLFEYGFTRYNQTSVSALLEQGKERFARVRIGGAAEDESLLLDIEALEGGHETVPVLSDSAASMSLALDRVCDGVRVEWLRELQAPVAEGEVLGRLTCEIDGKTVTGELVSPRSVAPMQMGNAGADTPDSGARSAGQSGGSDSAMKMLLILVLALMAGLAVVFVIQRRSGRRRSRRRTPARRQARGGAYRGAAARSESAYRGRTAARGNRTGTARAADARARRR